MSETSELRAECWRCRGDGQYSNTTPPDPINLVDCPECSATGYVTFGQLAFNLSDLSDRLDDILDKCNDILEKVGQ